MLDPDRASSTRCAIFETFARTGSARAVVQAFNQEGLRFPRRVRERRAQGRARSGRAAHWRVLRTLHNPRYAGAFVYGRRRTRKDAEGSTASASCHASSGRR